MSGLPEQEFVADPVRWGSGQLRLRSNVTKGNTKGIVLLIHGAGHNSLVWSRCAAGMAERGFDVFAMDLRAHGDSTAGETDADTSFTLLSDGQHAPTNPTNVSNHTPIDLSMPTLVKDTEVVIQHILKRYKRLNGADGEMQRKVALIGHSLGGAVAVRTCVFGKKIINLFCFRRSILPLFRSILALILYWC